MQRKNYYPLDKLNFNLQILLSKTPQPKIKQALIKKQILAAIADPDFIGRLSKDEKIFWKLLKLNNDVLLRAFFERLKPTPNVMAEFVNKATEDGRTPLSATSHPETTALLTEYGASRVIALTVAMRANNQPLAKHIIGWCNKADLETAIDKLNPSALWFALNNNLNLVISALCEKKAGLYIGSHAETPMSFAITKKNCLAVHALRTAGVTPTADDLRAIVKSDDVSLLQAACSTEDLKKLVKETIDKDGNTLLHTAIWRGYNHTQMCHRLCQAGADVNARNRAGHTAFQFVFFHRSTLHNFDYLTLSLLLSSYHASARIEDDALRAKAIQLCGGLLPARRERLFDAIGRDNPSASTLVSRELLETTYTRERLQHIPASITALPLSLFPRVGWRPDLGIHYLTTKRKRATVVGALSLVISRAAQNPLSRLPRELLFLTFAFLIRDFSANTRVITERYEKYRLEMEAKKVTEENKSSEGLRVRRG